MTKGELIKALQENGLPNDTEVLIRIGEYHEGEAAWNEIEFVDKNGIPILIGLGKTVMC